MRRTREQLGAEFMLLVVGFLPSRRIPNYKPDDVVAAEAQARLRASSAIVNKLVEEEEE